MLEESIDSHFRETSSLQEMLQSNTPSVVAILLNIHIVLELGAMDEKFARLSLQGIKEFALCLLSIC